MYTYSKKRPAGSRAFSWRLPSLVSRGVSLSKHNKCFVDTAPSFALVTCLDSGESLLILLVYQCGCTASFLCLQVFLLRPYEAITKCVSRSDVMFSRKICDSPTLVNNSAQVIVLWCWCMASFLCLKVFVLCLCYKMNVTKCHDISREQLW